MDREEFLKAMRSQTYIVAGSDAHLHMHEMSRRALRYTAEINGKYHSPEELRRLFFE